MFVRNHQLTCLSHSLSCLLIVHIMFYIQYEVKALEQELKEINSNHATLKRNLTELLEIHALLGVIQDFFQEVKNKKF